MKIKWTALSMIYLYILTFMCNPGIFIEGRMRFFEDIDWEVWFIVLIANLGDMFGRFTYNWYPTKNFLFLQTLPLF